ncbi:hypothetical protein [Metallosphaera javensis (ex Sakai et al. 2022)]|uniref:hypothetical protein n=1 Tax=Metallosphaera javensis (ex Sakai et al. 2022) TaxID=2775498 RepID=UPI00258CBBE5|nr:MAG: hypothetical protein MjAS7_1288 [Metallosphaera javensis (ex Sakai et al. 2022)]
MQIFRYSLINGELYPDEKGEVLVFVDGSLVSVLSGDRRVENPVFHLSREEASLVQQVKKLSQLTGVDVDLLPVLAYPGKARLISLNRVMGYIFEEFVYRTLSHQFKVERHVKTFESLFRLTGERYHNIPDMLVEGRIPVEAKISFYNYDQLQEYSTRFPTGALVLPYSSSCRVPSGWRYFTNFLVDQKPLLNWLHSLLLV